MRARDPHGIETVRKTHSSRPISHIENASSRFDDDTHTRRPDRILGLERFGEQRGALERGEFVLHCQPNVGMDSRAIEGVEALIRWNSPELGPVPPLKFISLLEETGLIVEVGLWADDPDNMTLVSTMISLAHSLRMKVIAEGVETEEQAKMPRPLRCDQMQGSSLAGRFRRQHLHGQEEARPTSDPALTVGRDAATGHDAVQCGWCIRVWPQVCSTAMKPMSAPRCFG